MEPSTIEGISAGVGAIGSLVSGVSQYSQSQTNAGIDKANAQIAENEANADAATIRLNAERAHGSNVAAASASGVDLSGSFSDAIADSDQQAELDALTTQYNGRMKAKGFNMQADAADASATGALIKGGLGAGTQALSGYGNWRLLSSKGY